MTAANSQFSPTSSLFQFTTHCIEPLLNFPTTFDVLKLESLDYQSIIWWKPHDRRSVFVKIISQCHRQTDRRTVKTI